MFLAFLLFLTSCSNDLCLFDVDGTMIDLSDLRVAKENYHYTDPTYGEFVFHICGDLLKSDADVPSCGVENAGWSGAAVDNDGNCYLTAASDSFTVTKTTDTTFHIEFAADTDKEPDSIDEVRTVYDFVCDDSTNTEPLGVSVRDEAHNRYIIIQHSVKCDSPYQPTPQPTPVGNMVFTKASTTKQGLGIQFNLSEFEVLERGPISQDGGQYELIFGPGHLIKCPFPYNCQHITPSSLYVCRSGNLARRNDNLGAFNFDKGYCASYGIANSSIQFNQDGISESEGVYAKYLSNDAGKTANVFFKCDASSKSHVLSLVSMKSNNDQLEVSVRTSDSCIRTVTPVPDPSHEFCVHSSIQSSHKVEFDLRELNVLHGYSQDVTITNLGNQQKTATKVVMQPCGALSCPDNYNCGSETRSSFWKCVDNSCESAGDVAAGDFHLTRTGVEVTTAEFGSSLYGAKTASVEYRCDINADSIYIDQSGTLDSSGKTTIKVYGKEFCPLDKTPEEEGGDGLSGGAIFLIILVCVVVAYFGFGIIIIYIKDHTFSIPNKSFWIEFGACIKASLSFIFSCGKSVDSNLQSKYDAI